MLVPASAPQTSRVTLTPGRTQRPPRAGVMPENATLPKGLPLPSSFVHYQQAARELNKNQKAGLHESPDHWFSVEHGVVLMHLLLGGRYRHMWIFETVGPQGEEACIKGWPRAAVGGRHT